MLLRNLFNIDVYNAFIKQKKEMRNQFKQQYAERQRQVMQYINRQKLQGRDIDFRVSRRLHEIKQLRSSSKKKDLIIELFDQ